MPDLYMSMLLDEIAEALRTIPADAPAEYIGHRDQAIAACLEAVTEHGAHPEAVLPVLMDQLERASRPPLAALERGVTDDALRALLSGGA